MAIKRYTAIADNTITNQYNEALSSRMTTSNAGLADSVEIFKIYGQLEANTVEQSRVLIKFDLKKPMSMIPTWSILQRENGGLGFGITKSNHHRILTS